LSRGCCWSPLWLRGRTKLLLLSRGGRSELLLGRGCSELLLLLLSRGSLLLGPWRGRVVDEVLMSSPLLRSELLLLEGDLLLLDSIEGLQRLSLVRSSLKG